MCVLVGTVGVKVVEGGGLTRVPVASREVYAHCKVDLAASHDVLQEGVGSCDLRVGGGQLGCSRESQTAAAAGPTFTLCR